MSCWLGGRPALADERPEMRERSLESLLRRRRVEARPVIAVETVIGVINVHRALRMRRRECLYILKRNVRVKRAEMQDHRTLRPQFRVSGHATTVVA